MEQTFKLIVCFHCRRLRTLSCGIPLQMEDVAKWWVVASTETIQEALSLCREVRKYVHYDFCLFVVRCLWKDLPMQGSVQRDLCLPGLHWPDGIQTIVMAGFCKRVLQTLEDVMTQAPLTAAFLKQTRFLCCQFNVHLSFTFLSCLAMDEKYSLPSGAAPH